MDNMKARSLYEEDFLAWTAAQAEALRARGRGGNVIDFDRVAEEIEDLGRSELRACESLVRAILVHLAELILTRRDEPKAHWRAEVTTFRAELEGRLTATIRNALAAALPDLWRQAARIAAARMAANEPDAPTALPAAPPLTLDEIVDPDWWPAA